MTDTRKGSQLPVGDSVDSTALMILVQQPLTNPKTVVAPLSVVQLALLGLVVAKDGTVVMTGALQAPGVKMPATQIPSADANTLDDYEEGTWTPVLNIAGVPIVTAVTSARYTKIGERVFFNCQIIGTKAGAGAITLTGLPFPALDASPIALRGNSVTYAGPIQGYTLNSTVTFEVGFATAMADTNVNATFGLMLSGHYRA